NAALSSKDPMGNGYRWEWTIHSKKSDSNPQHQEIFLQEHDVDYDFFNTYKIPLLSGRYFSREMDQSSPVPFPVGDPRNNNFPRTDVIINSAAARQLGYISADEAIGEIIIQGEQGIPGYFEFSIIGVVEDSQYGNLRVETELAMYRLVPGRTFFLTVRYKGDYQKAVKEVERVWHEVVGDIPLQYSTVRQNMATVYAREITENMLLIAFALLAVFIACMGLFGMASFTVDRRVKEIGVRKVMGAKVKDIVRLLGWNFLKPVLFANLIAWPVAIFAMQSWLERFPYRFNPLFMIPICLISGFIALVIAWVTVAGNTIRVAKSKPIKALRYE
ncbi:ABC transporter permease, partial [Thermodesulfobacteriota bacterium]